MSMGSDLPPVRADIRAVAISFGETRTTCSSRADQCAFQSAGHVTTVFCCLHASIAARAARPVEQFAVAVVIGPLAGVTDLLADGILCDRCVGALVRINAEYQHEPVSSKFVGTRPYWQARRSREDGCLFVLLSSHGVAAGGTTKHIPPV